MKICFGYDNKIFDGNITDKEKHYYYNTYENISVPINGHHIIHKTFSSTSIQRDDHLTASNQQYPIDTIFRDNGVTVERGKVDDLIAQGNKFIYIIAPKYIMRLHSNIVPGAIRSIDGEKLPHFNYLKEILLKKHIDYINNDMCLFIISDIMECSWYTQSMLKSLKLMCIEIGLDYKKILLLTSNVQNLKNNNIQKSGINILYWQYWETAIKHLLQRNNIHYQDSCKPSKYKFLLLNSKSRRHRCYLSYKLWQSDSNFFNNFCISLDKVTVEELLSCHDYAARDGFLNSINFFNTLNIHEIYKLNTFLSQLPFITAYDSHFIETKLKNRLKSKQYVCNFNNTTNFFRIDHWDNIPEKMIHDTDIHIVTESLMEIPNTDTYSHLFLTEKTFKPIALKAPFILAAQSGALAHLRSNGYKTFHECWDEDYDTIVDPQERLDSIIHTILSIAKKPACTYNEIIKRAYTIAEYNYNVFLNRVPEKYVVENVVSFFK
jgi:hypothetical protein